jgi:peptidoglycan lytic transglycosylase G
VSRRGPVIEDVSRDDPAHRLGEARQIDELDSLAGLDALGWSADPWDDAEAAGTVERLRVQTRSVKWVAYIVLAIVIALTLAAGVAGWWYIRQINPAGEAGEAVSFTVNEEDTLRTISERLEEQELVVDAGLFRWYVDRHGGLEVIPGYYAIQTSDHMGNVLARLRTPPNQTYSKVTFPEGFTVREIATRLGEEIVPMRARRFLRAANDPEVVSAFRPEGITSLEGLLFPDTYQVSNGENEAQVVERMIGLMERVAKQEDIEIKGERLDQSPYDILTIASMIEEEAKLAEDRPKIARVIYNRLALGMPLEIDAAVRYGTEQQGLDPDKVSFPQQRARPGPYNTYANVGLPVTPITNPGRASIHAALNPAPDPSVGDPLCRDLPDDVECQYLYYVLANEDGGHAFAATGEQHAANVAACEAAGLCD